jgi:CheY-like chemotaxis protein
MRRDDKLLIVEDNPLIVAAIERAGERLNLQTCVATDGWDAIERLRTEEFDVIVVDADLPRHSGYGLLDYLREENGDDFVNVLVVTTDSQESMHQRFSDRLHVIAKSEAVDEITAAVSCCFDAPRE